MGRRANGPGFAARLRKRHPSAQRVVIPARAKREPGSKKDSRFNVLWSRIRLRPFRETPAAIWDWTEGVGLESSMIETARLLRRLCPWIGSQVYDRKTMLMSYEGSPAGLLRRSVMN